METVAGSVTENGYIGLSVKFSLIVKVGTALAAAPGRLPNNGNTTESVKAHKAHATEDPTWRIIKSYRCLCQQMPNRRYPYRRPRCQYLHLVCILEALRIHQ
jgi:hypothetical protein